MVPSVTTPSTSLLPAICPYCVSKTTGWYYYYHTYKPERIMRGEAKPPPPHDIRIIDSGLNHPEKTPQAEGKSYETLSERLNFLLHRASTLGLNHITSFCQKLLSVVHSKVLPLLE